MVSSLVDSFIEASPLLLGYFNLIHDCPLKTIEQILLVVR